MKRIKILPFIICLSITMPFCGFAEETVDDDYEYSDPVLDLETVSGVRITLKADRQMTEEEWNESSITLMDKVTTITKEFSITEDGDDKIVIEMMKVDDDDESIQEYCDFLTYPYSLEAVTFDEVIIDENTGDEEVDFSRPTVWLTDKNIVSAAAETIEYDPLPDDFDDVESGMDDETANIELTLDDEGNEILKDLLESHKEESLFWYYNGELISEIIINDDLLNGTVTITGIESGKEADTLAYKFNMGVTDVKFEVESYELIEY